MDFKTIDDFTGLAENYAASQGNQLDTGDLRRAYGFLPVPRIAELSIATEPFFGIMSKFKKQNVDESQFKYLEKRPSHHKRYAYVCAHGTTSGVAISQNATVSATNIAAGKIYYFKMGTDYKSAGNIGIIYDATGGTRNAFVIGSSGTKPEFFLNGQLIKIPFNDNAAPSSNAEAFAVDDSIICRIEGQINSGNYVILKTLVVKTLNASTNNELAGFGATDTSTDYALDTLTAGQLAKLRIHDQLERARVYVTGTAFAKGSGYPNSWNDNPFSTGMGLTEIWKTTAAMDNTTRATVLKYDGNEYQRIWGSKFLEHKSDIEKSMLFSHQSSFVDTNGKTIQTTQGGVDYALNYGNIFELDHSSYSADDFLNDMSIFMDVRYNGANPTLWQCDKYTLNWLMRLDGYATNNVVQASGGATQMSYQGWRDVNLGKNANIRMHTISTAYGDMNLIYNPHFDGTEIAIFAANLNHCKFRPLVGNGLNRNTGVYLGVQTLENSGIDGRVDLILTEAGMQWELPETCAVWKRK